MRIVVSDEDKIRVGNMITTNLLNILDKKEISNSEDKINDYANFLNERTNISLSRIKKMLTLNIKKLITAADIDELTKALNIKAVELFKDND